jgi:hypothetical protein
LHRRAEQALKALLSEPIYRKSVGEIRDKILQEDGVAALCTAVEQILRDSSV